MFRISRDINPGIDNFRNLSQSWFLLGAIGNFQSKFIFILMYFCKLIFVSGLYQLCSLHQYRVYGSYCNCKNSNDHNKQEHVTLFRDKIIAKKMLLVCEAGFDA